MNEKRKNILQRSSGHTHNEFCTRSLSVHEWAPIKGWEMSVIFFADTKDIVHIHRNHIAIYLSQQAPLECPNMLLLSTIMSIQQFFSAIFVRGNFLRCLYGIRNSCRDELNFVFRLIIHIVSKNDRSNGLKWDNLDRLGVSVSVWRQLTTHSSSSQDSFWNL